MHPFARVTMPSYPPLRHRMRKTRVRPSLRVFAPLLLLCAAVCILTAASRGAQRPGEYVSAPARAMLLSHGRRVNDNPPTSRRVIIFRALGNSLPPRHAPNQTFANLRFALRHEPRLPHVEKRWYVNRVLRAHEEAAIVELLLRHGQILHIDSLDWRRYRGLASRVDPAQRSWAPERVRRFAKRVPRAWMDHLRGKAGSVMHCNPARNRMLELGFSAGAEFVLPGDGNIFFTRDAWREVLSNIDQPAYYAIPMARLARNDELSSVRGELATEEPQIMFRRGAKERFDEGRVYGYAPKLSLLERLSKRGLSRSVGWCVRLADGKGRVMDGKERAMNRYEGAERALALADWIAFSGQSGGHGFDIGRCAMELRASPLSEELFQQLPLRDFGEMQESDVCHWAAAAIHKLPLNESRTLTDTEKVRVIILLESLITHPEMECMHEKTVLVTGWCRRFVDVTRKWENGWWLLGRGLDGLLAAFGGAFIRDYRFATRVGSAAHLAKEGVVEADFAEWVGCVERRIAWRVGSGGGKYVEEAHEIPSRTRK